MRNDVSVKVGTKFCDGHHFYFTRLKYPRIKFLLQELPLTRFRAPLVCLFFISSAIPHTSFFLPSHSQFFSLSLASILPSDLPTSRFASSASCNLLLPLSDRSTVRPMALKIPLARFSLARTHQREMNNDVKVIKSRGSSSGVELSRREPTSASGSRRSPGLEKSRVRRLRSVKSKCQEG